MEILISDTGRASMATEAGGLISRGYRTLVLDPVLFGDSVPGTRERPNLSSAAQMLNTIGERPLGIEAAQVLAVADWFRSASTEGTASPGSSAVPKPSLQKIGLITRGPRSQVIGLTALALGPATLFSSLQMEDGIKSLHDIFERKASYAETPELFCLDLYRNFDIDQLRQLAPQAEVSFAQESEAIFWR
jgi:hypothetical protein